MANRNCIGFKDRTFNVTPVTATGISITVGLAKPISKEPAPPLMMIFSKSAVPFAAGTTVSSAAPAAAADLRIKNNTSLFQPSARLLGGFCIKKDLFINDNHISQQIALLLNVLYLCLGQNHQDLRSHLKNGQEPFRFLHLALYLLGPSFQPH